MPSILAPYGDIGFDLVTLTNGINKIPNKYGRLNELGLFRDQPIDSRVVAVEMKNGLLNILDSKPLGSPAPGKKREDRSTRFFGVPYYPDQDVIYPRDFAGKRAFGTADQTNSAAQVIAERGAALKANHAITWEYARWRALDGILTDGTGKAIYNWFDEFGITRKVVDFDLDTATTEMEEKCHEVCLHIEENLFGETTNGNIRGFAGKTWMSKFIHHPMVEKYYLNHTAALKLSGSDTNPRKNFSFGGITFEEHNGKAPDANGTLRSFIPDDEVRFYPEGTSDTFVRYLAPGEFIEAVNTMGQELYMKQAEEEMGRWVNIHTESSFLTMCRRPEVLVKGI